ncbi:MAG: RNA-binding domain-containing protein [Candidatus Bathyarchaeia archaeon]
MDEISIHVEVDVYPTESEEKVKKAVENIFGNIQTRTRPSHRRNLLTTEAKGLEALTKLYNLLRRERIRDAARTVLFEGLTGKTISFCLNKQVAYTGHISFSKEVAESPLGPIRVRIECDNPRDLIDWLAPKTV